MNAWLLKAIAIIEKSIRVVNVVSELLYFDYIYVVESLDDYW